MIISPIDKLRELAKAKTPPGPVPFELASHGSYDRWAELPELARAALHLAVEAQAALIERQWQPIETAPVEPWTRDYPGFSRFHCLLQNEKGYVTEGWAYWVPPRRSIAPLMRWANKNGVCQPKYWMPLPQPHQES